MSGPAIATEDSENRDLKNEWKDPRFADEKFQDKKFPILIIRAFPLTARLFTAYSCPLFGEE